MTTRTPPETNWQRYQADADFLKRQAVKRMEQIAEATGDDQDQDGVLLEYLRQDLAKTEKAHSSKLAILSQIADRKLPVPRFK